MNSVKELWSFIAIIYLPMVLFGWYLSGLMFVEGMVFATVSLLATGLVFTILLKVRR